MRRWWLFVAGLMAVLLLAFTVVEALEIDLLVDPSPWLATASAAAAGIGVTLLLVDVLVPVPSSLVMIALGSLFGLWLGAALALIGTVGAGIIGFAIGRQGGGLVNRFVGPDERARAVSSPCSAGSLSPSRRSGSRRSRDTHRVNGQPT